MYDPAQRDSRRGLKMSWSKASSKPGEAGSSSTTKEKISSKDKGKKASKYLYLVGFLAHPHLVLSDIKSKYSLFRKVMPILQA